MDRVLVTAKVLEQNRNVLAVNGVSFCKLQSVRIIPRLSGDLDGSFDVIVEVRFLPSGEAATA